MSSLVLAGTMARGGSKADDEALAAALLASAKNAEEHQYSVDSVRELLAPLCTSLTVDPAPFLLQMADYQHLATSVTGELAGEPSALALAASLHPTAAICGTPTQTALELIRELEGMDRGRYSGPVGWVDGRGNGEWGIALRCGEIEGDRARLFAGCGIVAGCRPRQSSRSRRQSSGQCGGRWRAKPSAAERIRSPPDPRKGRGRLGSAEHGR